MSLCETVLSDIITSYSNVRPLDATSMFKTHLDEWNWGIMTVIDPKKRFQTKVEKIKCKIEYWNSVKEFLYRENSFNFESSLWKYVIMTNSKNPFSILNRLIETRSIPLKTKNDISKFKNRIYKFETQLTPYKQTIQEGIEKGIVPSRSGLQRLISSLLNLNIPSRIKEKKLDEWYYDHVIKNSMGFGMWLHYSVLPYTKHSLGCFEWPFGKDMYNQAIKLYCGKYNWKEIEALGWKEIEVIEKEQTVLIHSMLPHLSKQEFIKQIFRSKENKFQSKEELEQIVTSIFNDLESAMFTKLKKPSQYKKPTIVFYSDPYRYLGEANVGDLESHIYPRFFVNTANWNTVYKSDYIPFTLHEGFPGHCLHAFYIQNSSKKNPIAKLLHFTDVAEAIGLYSESLFDESPILKSKNKALQHLLENFSRLNFRIWRALRCVVDVGIHVHGYSQEKCLELMQTYCTHGKDVLINEIQRYGDNPGQACSYYVGFAQLQKCFSKNWKKQNKTKYDFYQCILENSAFDMKTILENCHPY